MTALVVPLLLATTLVATMLAGPKLVRAAAPALMRTPRTAVGLLLATVALWLLASAALSLMLAWLFTGPSVLPTSITGVCQRCIAAATPFPSTSPIDTAVPSAILVFLPAAALMALGGIAVARGARRRRRTAASARDITGRAQRITVYGHRVLMTRDPHPTAFSLPQRHGGIVISDTLIAVLHTHELVAVLAHEREHVHGHHHLVLAALDVLVAPLRWLPLMAAVTNAVPHYLEIAADDAARRSAGTPALAGALLKLGKPQTVGRAGPEPIMAQALLNAAGPDRIGNLVTPPPIRSAIAPIAVIGAVATAFAVVATSVHGPYLYVIAAGCHFPL
ncbi:Zn-dependent protease with chaperone function [Rhodoglobus vestalii]|uniref:Zn-dependent protease with chaperone function n=1 Tax=Rhodoglobus vestalii TaxID=193384 RepID=A0A8H2PTR6_9MICO|nr:M48 family metalloprotease [Rhodoglobus vestalii]TQO18817.1 Zn-dependent protease with chaperone function [Rhodoglobus vestalii]